MWQGHPKVLRNLSPADLLFDLKIATWNRDVAVVMCNGQTCLVITLIELSQVSLRSLLLRITVLKSHES